MSKVILNSSIKSSDKIDEEKSIKAIYKDNIINYVKDNISVSISILSNKVILRRENSEMILTLEFEKKKTLTTKYFIKDLNINIKVDTKTKELLINDNNLYIKYDLYMNDEFSDTFIYKLEWRDI